MLWKGKAQWVIPPCKVGILSHLWCLSKSQCWSFQQAQFDWHHVVHNLFNFCRNHTTFKQHWKRTQNMQFALLISDTSMTLKQSKGQSNLKDLALMVSKKRQTLKVFVQTRKYVNYLTSIYAKIKNLFDAMNTTIVQSFNWIRKYNFQLKLTLLWVWNTIKVTESGMNE